MPAGETCFNVSAGAPEHSKLEKAGGDAGWLWFCLLGYCKRSRSDGVFPAEKVRNVSDRRQPVKLLARLIDQDLAHGPGHGCKKCVQPPPGFYVLHDWAYWQGTVAEEKAEREADEAAREAKGTGGAYGNHRRWHAGRGRKDPDCEFCDPSLMRSDMRSLTDGISDRGPIGIRIASAMGSDGEPPFPPQTPPIPRVDITPPTPQADEPKRRTRRQAYDYATDLEFLRFWDAFPERSGKPAAFKAWLAARARGADPEVIIAAAIAYRDDPRRNPEKTKYPQGWLNDERYADEAPTGPQRERNYDF